MQAGVCDGAFPLDALQGGAGTSTNMNINEVLALYATGVLRQENDGADRVDPLEHVNLHQSTNDVYPTALKIAAIRGVRKVSESFALLQGACQRQEKEFASVVKMGRTEQVDAVPITLGAEIGAFAEAFSRDRWRTMKCEERLRVVNIGGTAVGTGLTAPRSYIFLVIEKLRSGTGLGLSRGENLPGETANADVFVEVSGILKACAVNLMKTADDLRRLNMLGDISLPVVQAGSSIMPGKANPVVPECVMQCAMLVKANDQIVADCASRGSLQIVEFLPLLASALLESIRVLSGAAELLAGCIDGIVANEESCRRRVEQSPALITALLPELGYNRCVELGQLFAGLTDKISFREFLEIHVGAEVVDRALSVQNLTSLGYRQQRSADDKRPGVDK